MTSTDPVVRDFFLDQRTADLTGPWRPGSIRDQAIRARLVVATALENGWISPTRPLAVIGAGVAGTIAALTAREAGVPVTIFEKENKPLKIQSASVRWVEPTAYDWPHRWWTEGTFPVSGPDGLKIEAGDGRAIALRLADLLVRDSGIRLRLSHAISLHELSDFALRVDCRGLTSETTRCGEFEGQPFWGDDPRTKLREYGAEPRVLISGGGDGAIQDFLLLATGEGSPVRLAQQVGLASSPSPGSRPELGEFELQAFSSLAPVPLHSRAQRRFSFSLLPAEPRPCDSRRASIRTHGAYRGPQRDGLEHSQFRHHHRAPRSQVRIPA